MLIQHLLTERIFERIFDNPDFTRRNVVAAEIEKVIVELTKRAFNRNEFLRPLDRFYKAIEVSTENTTGFSEKQAFLNKVYERFFQGYSPKEADTHGIVYTPQPIVNFMVRSVQEILQKEFGRSLGDKGVHILDPFVGTGNFIVRIMQEINATDLPYKYENELHCNEVMLLPYYIASMNIEHSYFDRTGEYKAFPGICLVDTFELAEAEQASLGFMTEENAQRVKRQKESPIFVVIGNPPYNANQQNEDDNNKNRKNHVVDRRISETLHVGGRPSQVFPFYTYAEDGTHRRENITDWALDQIPLPLPRPLHRQVGHLPLHLRRPAPPRLPPALRRQPQARTAAHPFRERSPCSVIPSGAGRFACETSCAVVGPRARQDPATARRGVRTTNFRPRRPQQEFLAGPTNGASRHGVFRLRSR